ncbi:MAG: endonuclease domain-containing protein [Methylococcaceae bacterium]
MKIMVHKDIPELTKKLMEKQKNKCPICENEIKRPCLDHSHTKRVKGTGLVRGVLCSNCNVFLAKIENNCTRYGIQMSDLPDILINTSYYLSRPHLDYLHPSEAPKAPILKQSSYNKLKKLATSKAIKKIPPYPRSGHLTKPLAKLYNKINIQPEFYRGK